MPGIGRGLSPLYKNWVIDILPFIEEKTLYQQFDLRQPISGRAETNPNAQARRATVSIMLCPSDSHNQTQFDPQGIAALALLGPDCARGNYAANASLGYMSNGLPGSADAGNPAVFRSPLFRGVMGANDALKITEIRDGSSKTILLGEVRAGIAAIDCRGTWAMSGAPTALWACGYDGDDNGPNYNAVNLTYVGNLAMADDIEACSDVAALFGGKLELARLGMSCSTG